MKPENEYAFQAESSNAVNRNDEPSALPFKLKIGYDGKRAANNLTGLGNYSRSLIEQLAIQFPQHEYVVYTPKIKPALADLPLFSLANVKLVLPIAKKWLWRSFGIKKQLLTDKINLFHGLSHEIPVGLANTEIKCIVTMHDLIFLRLPAYYTWIDRQIYRLKSNYACKNADRIIAISEKTKNDIVELYRISPSKIDVVYQSCDDSFKATIPENIRQQVQLKYHLPSKFILYVGTIESRKNLLALVKALPKIELDTKLVVVGRVTSYTKSVIEEIKKLNLQDRVLFLKVPFLDLPAIYQLAEVFVLPSYYEGFGIPIIEALYSKVPVVAATGSCLEEAGGPHSLYFQPDDIEALASKVNIVLSDKQIAEEMTYHGYNYVQRFNSNVVNQQLIACYQKTMDK